MKSLIALFSILILSSYPNICVNADSIDASKSLIGKWVRIGTSGPIAMEFKEGGIVEVDFGNDGSVDVSSTYQLSEQGVTFNDEEGAMCHEPGEYQLKLNEYYVSFDLVKDNCGGRIKSTMGFWTKPEFKQLINNLNAEIAAEPKPELLLSRARIFMAVGDSPRSLADLDKYIEQIDTNSMAFLNRAATQMPSDFSGVVADCNKSIQLDPDNKNTYFLRGLARYELGEREQACADFEKAIQLGFSVLRMAEQQKCQQFWEKK